MKFYPDGDVHFYVEKHICHQLNSNCERLPEKSFRPKYMYHWRDSEGVKMIEIKKKDLYFEKYPKTRIRSQACLGLLYANGIRFIKLAMAPPGIFKCAPLPVNLETARVIKKLLGKKKKAERLAKKKAQKEAKAKKKAEKAYKNRGHRRGRN